MLHRGLRLHGNDKLRLRRAQGSGHQSPGKFAGRHHHSARFAVVQNMLVVAFGVGHIGGNSDTSSGHNSKIRNAPFGPVFRHQHHTVALFKAQLTECFSETGDLLGNI